MAFEPLKVNLADVFGRITNPISDLVEKVKAQNLRVPQIRLPTKQIQQTATQVSQIPGRIAKGFLAEKPGTFTESASPP